jgi:hypothetical protein
MTFGDTFVFPDTGMHDKTVRFASLFGEEPQHLAITVLIGCSVRPYYSIIAAGQAVNRRTLAIKPHACSDFFEFVTQLLFDP